MFMRKFFVVYLLNCFYLYLLLVWLLIFILLVGRTTLAVVSLKLGFYFMSLLLCLTFILLWQLLEKITEKFDSIISSFTHLDKEFSHMIQITKSYQFLGDIESGVLGHGVAMKAKLSWATLHSLLHSDRIAYRHNGYTWLGDLLIAETSRDRNASIWSTIRNLQRQLALAGVQDSSDSSDLPLSISLMCGLLKSKHNIIRWGFLFVLERLLMRCKFLLDENEQQSSSSGQIHVDSRIEKANVMIDIMSSALSFVAQKETDRINILKVICVCV